MIPVWDDYVEFLPVAVEGLLAEFPEARLLVMDNASKVPIDPLGCELTRSTRRLSRGMARNHALAVVETELVLFWDVDDRIVPGAGSALLEPFGDPRVLLSSGRIVTPDGADHGWPPPGIGSIQSRPRLLALAAISWHAFPVTRSVVRTRALRDVGGFSDRSGPEDWSPAARLAARGRISLSPEPVFTYRTHPGHLETPVSAFLQLGPAIAGAVMADREADPLVRLAAPLAVAFQILWALARRLRRR